MRRTLPRLTVALLGALALGLLAGPAPASHAPTTLTLVSGNGAVGTRDMLNQFSDAGITWQEAFIVAPLAVYSVIPGTRWIARRADQTGPSGTTTVYRTFFTLPDGFTSAALTVQVHADNQATVRLNGFAIGQQPAGGAANFQDPAEVFTATNQALFPPGPNTLILAVRNINSETGVDYRAEVRFDGPCAHPTLVGTPGNDGIVRLSGPEVIDGLGGNDAIVTGPFDDVVCGGPGTDVIDAGGGDDRIFGQDDADTLGGGDGNDRLFGEAGADRLGGQAGVDVLFGGVDDDFLDGGSGLDTLRGGPGFDACVDPIGPPALTSCP